MLILVPGSGPPTEPLSLTEAKAHLRIDQNNDDTYVSGLISAARQFIETETDTCLVDTTWIEELPSFPHHSSTIGWHYHVYGNKLKLTKYPLDALSSVQYYDGNNDLQLLDSDSYFLSAPSNSQAWLEALACWPVTYVRPDAVQVTYSVLNTNNQELVKACMLLLIGHLYENREQEVTGTIVSSLSLGIDRLLKLIDRRGYQ